MKANIKKIFLLLPKVSFVLADRKLGKTIYLYLQIVTTSINWKMKGTYEKKFSFCFEGVNFEYTLRDNTDIAALIEIYAEEEYRWDELSSPEYIIDLGANYGDTSLYFAIKYPQAKIIAVEPSPDSFARLQKHASQFTNIQPVHGALADIDGQIELHLMPGSSLGHSIRKRSEGADVVEVPAITLKTIFDKYDIKKECLVKFDIEGGEEALFNQIKNFPQVNSLIGEVHYDLIDLSPEEVTNKLSDFSLQIQNLNQKDRVIIRATKN
jgi:FkbM family methyltransferase